MTLWQGLAGTQRQARELISDPRTAAKTRLLLFNRTQSRVVKQSHYRPWQALRAPGGRGSQVFRQSAHEGGKVFSPTHRPPLLPRKDSWYSFLLEAESTPAIVRPKRLCQWKSPVTPSGIEPATFRFVAQCLSQLRHRVLQNYLFNTA
jgi:hypothetical protein